MHWPVEDSRVLQLKRGVVHRLMVVMPTCDDSTVFRAAINQSSMAT